MFHKLLDQGQAGDNAGLLLRGIERTDVERGQVLFVSQVLSNLIQSSKPRYTYWRKMKVDVILHSSRDTSLSSTSERLMWLVLSSFQQVSRWSCLVIISRWQSSSVLQSLWIRVFASLSVKVVVLLVLVSLQSSCIIIFMCSSGRNSLGVTSFISSFLKSMATKNREIYE